jgi:hypothetical protein
VAGDIRQKERAIVTLTSTGSSLANGSAGSAGTDFDARAAGNFADDMAAQFELTCQWATITGIVAGTVVAELYLVPKLDGTNLPDVDLTAGTSRLPFAAFASAFEAQKAPTANTNARFVSTLVQFNPLLFTAYILNRSGQTMAVNWSLKAVGVQGQYT